MAEAHLKTFPARLNGSEWFMLLLFPNEQRLFAQEISKIKKLPWYFQGS
jgi:hypothetical protein